MWNLIKSDIRIAMLKKILLCMVFYCVSPAAVALDFEGDFTQGGLLQGRVEPGSKVYFKKREISVSSEGVFLLGFGRNAGLQQEVTVELPDGSRKIHKIELSKRKYKEQRINGLPSNKVSPSKEELDRIWREKALLTAAREFDSSHNDFLSKFIWPVTGFISGVYGSRRILNGTPKRPHYGVDVAAPNGTPIKAPVGGIVRLVHQDMFFTGGTLVLDHGHGLSSTFIHLSKILVEKGAEIKQGQVIAEVGATGRATGPHLHWSLNWFKTPLDPALLVGPMPDASK